MNSFRCPGVAMSHWKPSDIFDVPCPRCGASVEFFKDEPALPCPSCRVEVRNPRINPGCAEWCRYAKERLGETPACGG